MSSDVVIAGVGMTDFHTPRLSPPYTELAADAVRTALADAGIGFPQVEQIYAGYVYGDSTAGQRAVYDVGLSGVPIFNVNNNCATGSSALYLACQAVASGAVQCALALGFEQMPPGAIGENFADRPSPMDQLLTVADRRHGPSDAPMALRLFGGAATDYSERFGVGSETFARVAVKARSHARHNPNAVFRTPVSLEEVLASPMMFPPILTRLQCCPPTCGGAAAVVTSSEFADRHASGKTVKVRAQALTTDQADAFEGDMIDAVGAGMSRRASAEVYESAGVEPADIDVIELHDCFTANEIISYEALGLASAGNAEAFIHDGDNTYGGRHVVNPSGGLLSKGHPLGATGLAQCHELVTQLRGAAGKRQVEGARLGLQHNLGLGGACVVTLFEA